MGTRLKQEVYPMERQVSTEGRWLHDGPKLESTLGWVTHSLSHSSFSLYSEQLNHSWAEERAYTVSCRKSQDLQERHQDSVIKVGKDLPILSVPTALVKVKLLHHMKEGNRTHMDPIVQLRAKRWVATIPIHTLLWARYLTQAHRSALTLGKQCTTSRSHL